MYTERNLLKAQYVHDTFQTMDEEWRVYLSLTWRQVLYFVVDPWELLRLNLRYLSQTRSVLRRSNRSGLPEFQREQMPYSVQCNAST